MKKINRKSFFGATVAIAIALALIMPMSIAIVNETTTQPVAIRNQVKEYKMIKPLVKNSRSDNILVSYTPGDDIIPGITKDAFGYTVVTWTNKQDTVTWNMGIAYSATPTDPYTWAGWIVALTGTTMLYSSDTAFVIGPDPDDYTGLFGVNMYYDTLQVGYYEIPNILDDPSLWLFYYWSGVADDPTYATIEDHGYYYEPYYDRWGAVNMYIYHWNDLGYDVQDCPMYYLTDSVGGGCTMFFDAQSHLWTAPAKDPAMAMLPDWFHLAWEYHNATTDTDQIVWKKIDSAVEADIEFTPYQEYVADGKNPEIAAYEEDSEYYVAIVYVDGTDVKCIYSADDGETWSAPVTVATGSYPALCAIGTDLYCAYVDGGDLFLKISDDGGANWGTAEQINDNPGTVSAEENGVDIHPAGIVWVDTRDGEKEIYFAALAGVNNPPDTPTIQGEKKLKVNKEFEFTFTATDPDGDQVFYYIEWGDNNTVVWDGPHDSGVPLKLKHTWTTKDQFTIRCKAKDTNDYESDWAELKVSTPRTRFMAFRFLDYFPNAFPFLRLIFGF